MQDTTARASSVKNAGNGIGVISKEETKMKRNAKMAVVLSALVALTMAFASCGKNDSSSKADTSSAASSAAESTADSTAEESKAEESKAEESKAEESQAEESKAEESQGGAEAAAVDMDVLTGSVWTSSSYVKEDKTTITPDELAAQMGKDVADIASNIAFGTDGTVVLVSGATGAVAGTYTVEGNKITATIAEQVQTFEMNQTDGTWVLGAEEDQVTEQGVKGTIFAANPALQVADVLAMANGGAQQGGEQGAEGGEQGAEGGEEGGEEAGAEEGGEEAAE